MWLFFCCFDFFVFELGVCFVLVNFGYLLGGKVVVGVLSFVYFVFVMYWLGVVEYGVLVLVNVYVVLIGSLFVFLGFYGVVCYGGIVLELGDCVGFVWIVWFMVVIEIGCGVVVILVVVIFVLLIGLWFGWLVDMICIVIFYSLVVIVIVCVML